MSVAWIAAQIRAMKADAPRPVRFNPRPPGVIQPGSASEAVLKVLNEQPGRLYTCQQLIEKTGRSHAAVSWACIYLRDQGLIEAVVDGARNHRWLRYRIAKES